MARDGEDPLMALDGDVVELTVPAESAYLAVVRTATAGLAARLSFSLDEVEDLRIAVDEACAMLLTLPPPQGGDVPELLCRYRVMDDGLAVTVSVATSNRGALPERQSFAWQVLTAHASEVSGHTDEGRASIGLTKHRSPR